MKTPIDFAETSNFSDVSRVITTLSTSDERIAEELRDLKADPGKQEKCIIEIDGYTLNLLIWNQKNSKRLSLPKFGKVLAGLTGCLYDEAKTVAFMRGIKNNREWRTFANSDQRPADIPHNPDQAYVGKRR